MKNDYGSPDKLQHIAAQYLERKATAEEVAKALVEYLDRLGRPIDNEELLELHKAIQVNIQVTRHQNIWRTTGGSGWDFEGIGGMVREIGHTLAARLWDMGYRRSNEAHAEIRRLKEAARDAAKSIRRGLDANPAAYANGRAELMAAGQRLEQAIRLAATAGVGE